MYIISKNKDYYDGVVGSVGMDKTIVYERTTDEIIENHKMPDEFNGKKYSWDKTSPFLSVCGVDVDKKNKKYSDVHGFIVGFCGKLYLGWKFDYKIKVWNNEYHEYREDIKTDFIYGYENAKKYLKANYWRSNLGDDVKYVMNYDPINLFRKNKTPIFIYDGDKRSPRNSSVFIINPILKEYEFYKVMDSFTAFTELQMFIGGVLGIGEKEIVEIDDKYKIPQHGFDKWSFRRMPSKKK